MALSFGVFAPPAHAEPIQIAPGQIAPPPAFTEARPMPTGTVIRPGQWFAIGAGVVAGALAVEVLIPTHLIYVTGSLAGGYLANIWYTGRQLSIHTTP